MHLPSLAPILLLLLGLTTTILAAPRPLHKAPTPHSLLARSGLLKRASGGVKLCTGANYSGICDYVVWPLNECIALNDYAGHTLSFQPDAGTECFLMQRVPSRFLPPSPGRCNSEKVYADLLNDTAEDADLSGLAWIGQSESYLCLSPLG
ncbi:hypothetical protein B0A54_13873 [Friedmanniomyces endolithicus]|uniref:LysM domain-containing protein n=1 Tax=Friedmanniomyces endolithicus TaxID=329885 RepID=A0A4U0UH29_9PEZI|nr:hypothetical protein B0A54_13873 [Friedmanniomyces endolithicus]